MNEQDLIRELAKLLDETELTEIEVEREGLRVRVARQSVTHVVAGGGALASAGPAISAPAAIVPAPAPDHATHPGVVTSPFVDVGSVVKAGDTLLIIEAMKTMNQIPAPRAGTVTQILFEDGNPVEYGEPLMIVE